MAIQQSHFYTSDNWSVFFIALTLYTAILIAENGRSWLDWVMFTSMMLSALPIGPMHPPKVLLIICLNVRPAIS